MSLRALELSVAGPKSATQESAAGRESAAPEHSRSPKRVTQVIRGKSLPHRGMDMERKAGVYPLYLAGAPSLGTSAPLMGSMRRRRIRPA